jgi:hypothetical protein
MGSDPYLETTSLGVSMGIKRTDECDKLESKQSEILEDLKEVFQKHSIGLMVVMVQRTHMVSEEDHHTHQSTWLMSPDRPTGKLLAAGDAIRAYQGTADIILDHTSNLLSGCIEDITVPYYSKEKEEIELVRNTLSALLETSVLTAESSSNILRRATDSLRDKIEDEDREDGKMREELAKLDEEGPDEDDELIQKTRALLKKQGKFGLN